MEESKIIDAVLDELMETLNPSMSVSRIVRRKKIACTEDQIASIETVLRTKSLVVERSKGLHGESEFALTETGEHFMKMFGSYSGYLAGIEKEKIKVERLKSKKQQKPVAAVADTNEVSNLNEALNLNKEEAEATDIVLSVLKTTTQPYISVNRILKKSGIKFADKQIRSIEKVLSTKGLVDKNGKDSQGYDCFSLNSTGEDFIKTFGSYSKFLKGIESENRSIKRVKGKKPYLAKKAKEEENTPSAYVPSEKSFLEKNWLGIAILLLVIAAFYSVYNLS